MNDKGAQQAQEWAALCFYTLDTVYLLCGVAVQMAILSFFESVFASPDFLRIILPSRPFPFLFVLLLVSNATTFFSVFFQTFSHHSLRANAGLFSAPLWCSELLRWALFSYPFFSILSPPFRCGHNAYFVSGGLKLNLVAVEISG
ncbi:hypothetical protein M440DRAFT_1029256 [Trichoderma longibrachiatum ATCC 18648]|uniref:Uncharacterized protein n=1 Tax=Trichoderma longibrachiatum ATCC 18648 TaxID=983965 RepID=A0A2T4BZ91_TRILO|nr:hypothetical protein M440DRAFT_1029256 [Trichoderma longibrachiatum ATCC 18648]